MMKKAIPLQVELMPLVGMQIINQQHQDIRIKTRQLTALNQIIQTMMSAP